MKNYLKLLWYKRKLLFMRRHPDFCFWLPRTAQMIYFGVTQATYSTANHRLALSNLFSRHCPGAWAPHALMTQTPQCGSSSVVLMHALKVAVLLECQVLFDCVFCISLVCFEDFSGQTDIRQGAGLLLSLSPCWGQQVAGFQMCQPIFINISSLSCWAVAQLRVWLQLLWFLCWMPVFFAV